MIKILLLHGMGGSGEDFRFLLDRYPLARALNLDQEDFASSSDFVRRQIRNFQPHLICGYSMGGRIAIHALAAEMGSIDPSLLPQGLLLVSSGLGLENEAEKQARRESEQKWADLLDRDPAAFWLQWYQQPLFSLGERAQDAAEWLSRRKSSQAADSTRIRRHLLTYSPAEHHYLLDDLLRIKSGGVSTLYLAGENDKKYRDLAARLAGHGIPVEIVAEVGHAIPLEKPQALADAIEKWEKNWRENGKKH